MLRERDIPLIVEREGVASARRAAEHAAVARYRRKVIVRGDSLDLSGLGLALPDIPLAEADAEMGVARTDETRSERRLTWSLRRHGRLLLTGPPGGGKSTTLRASAADYARRDDWPLPVYAKLTDLARALEGRSFQQALFEAAIPALDLSDEDRGLVWGAYQRALADGRLALFLDALDETRHERFMTVQRVGRFLDEAHPDIELTVATRQVAYADARPLQFREVEVISPRSPERTTRRVLEEAAAVAGVRDEEREQWIAKRQRWVQQVLERDHTLSRTPLIPVVLSVLAAQHVESSLPRTRAQILRMVMEDIVRGWEAAGRRAGRIDLGGVLAGERAVSALTRSFATIGCAIIRDGVSDHLTIEKLLRCQLCEDFNLPTVDAEIGARELLAFWDEAGVFIADAAGRITARLQLFAETAAAISIAGLAGDELNVAVFEAVEESDQYETVKLAAGLSDAVAAALWRFIAEVSGEKRLPAARLLAAAVAEGAALDDGQRIALARILADAVDPERPSDGWAIARLRLAGEAAGALAAEVDQRLDPQSRLVFRALTAVHRDHLDADARRHLRAVLEADSIKISRSITVDDGYSEAMVGAAERLREGTGEDKRAIEAGLGKASMSVDQTLAAILIEIGRSEAVSRYHQERLGHMRISEWFDVEARSDRVLIDLLAQLAEPTELTYREERRLDELCDLVATIGIPDAAAADITGSVAKSPEEVNTLLRHVAPLTGIDISVAAAQARLVQQLLDTSDGFAAFGMLFDDGHDRGFKHWNLAADQRHLRNALRAHMAGWRWLAVAAAKAYCEAPDRLAATSELAAVLDDYDLWNRWLAAKVLLIVDPQPLRRAEEWIAAHDAIKRQVAAEVLAREIAVVGDSRLLMCLGDKDEGVRAAMYKQLRPETLTPALRERAWREVTGDPTGWRCLHCGRANDANASGCVQCSTSGPDAARAARDLLTAAGEDVPDLKDFVRRHVKVIDVDDVAGKGP